MKAVFYGIVCLLSEVNKGGFSYVRAEQPAFHALGKGNKADYIITLKEKFGERQVEEDKLPTTSDEMALF